MKNWAGLGFGRGLKKQLKRYYELSVLLSHLAVSNMMPVAKSNAQGVTR